MKKTNFEDAKKILSDSGKAGRLIASSDGNWIIEYLPERQKEYDFLSRNNFELIKDLNRENGNKLFKKINP